MPTENTCQEQLLWQYINLRNEPKNITTILDFTYLDQQVRQDVEKQCRGTNIHFIDEGGSFSPIARDNGIWVRAITARLRNNTSSFLWYITKFSKSPYLQLKRDFTTINVSAIASNTCFTAINASFGYHAKLLGGYFTPLEVQVKEEVKLPLRFCGASNRSKCLCRRVRKPTSWIGG